MSIPSEVVDAVHETINNVRKLARNKELARKHPDFFETQRWFLKQMHNALEEDNELYLAAIYMMAEVYEVILKKV